MTPDTARLVPSPQEDLPSFQFLLSFADETIKQSLMAQMRANQRQTMNLRLSTTAKLLHLQRLEDGATVGWGGVDAGHPSHPELFSFFLIPEYRSHSLGLLLELVRYTYLLSRGFKTAYLRMEMASNTSLIRYRLSSGLFKQLEPAQLDPAYLKLCQKCELYERECTQQGFFQVDVEAFVRHGEKRLGPLDVDSLPRQFTLSRETPHGSVPPTAREVWYRPIWR